MNQCQWCETHPTLPQCTLPATRKWGDHWFCETHGTRRKKETKSQDKTKKMNSSEISSNISSKTLRPISYPHRVWETYSDPTIPRRYTDHIRIGHFHGFGIEGSAGDEIVTVCIIEAEDGSIVTPYANKCKFLQSVTKLID